MLRALKKFSVSAVFWQFCSYVQYPGIYSGSYLEMGEILSVFPLIINNHTLTCKQINVQLEL